MAQGEIISFLDSDDEWLPDKTERQVKLLQATESSGVKCCVCNARMEFITGTVNSFEAICNACIQERQGGNPAGSTGGRYSYHFRFLFFNQVVAVRRDALEQVAIFRQGIMEDYDLALRLSLVGLWAFIAEPLVVWHEAGDNLSRTHSQLEISQRTLEILKDAGSSSYWGPLLPEILLRRRLRVLEQGIGALRLSAQMNPMTRLFGKLLLLYFRGCDALHRRGSSYPHMITRAI